MTEKELIQDFVNSQRELKQKLIEEHRERISRGEELDFVCFELYKELQEQNTNLQIMLQAEREVRCNEDYLKKVTELEAQIEKMKHYLNEFMRISVASVEEFEPEFSELVGDVETFLEK